MSMTFFLSPLQSAVASFAYMVHARKSSRFPLFSSEHFVPRNHPLRKDSKVVSESSWLDSQSTVARILCISRLPSIGYCVSDPAARRGYKGYRGAGVSDTHTTEKEITSTVGHGGVLIMKPSPSEGLENPCWEVARDARCLSVGPALLFHLRLEVTHTCINGPCWKGWCLHAFKRAMQGRCSFAISRLQVEHNLSSTWRLRNGRLHNESDSWPQKIEGACGRYVLPRTLRHCDKKRYFVPNIFLLSA